MQKSDEIILLVDTELKRPGCVLLQAAYGADRNEFNRINFPVDSWLLAPTPNMALVRGTREQWEKFRDGILAQMARPD